MTTRPAGLDVTLGNTVPDAARGTGDEGNLAVELHGKRSLVFDTDDLAQSEREVAFIGEGFPSCVCSDQYRAPE